MEKETKKCPYCGEEILAVAKKCKHCGEWLEEKPKKMVPCPVCGEEIEEGTTICPHCKEKLVKTEQVVEQKVVTINIPSSTASVVENATKIFEVDESKRFFKDFLAGHSIGKLILIAILINFLFNLLGGLTGITAIGIIGTIISEVFGAILSIILLQRITEDKSKVDVATWLRLLSEIPFIIGGLVACYGISNPGLDILECSRWDDPSEGVITFRYAIYCGFYWFLIGLVSEALSMFLVWQTAKDKYKTPALLSVISYIMFIVYIMVYKSLSAVPLFLFLAVPSVLLFASNIWIVIKAWKEYGVTEQAIDSANIKRGSFFEEHSFLIIFGGILLTALIIGIIVANYI